MRSRCACLPRRRSANRPSPVVAGPRAGQLDFAERGWEDAYRRCVEELGARRLHRRDRSELVHRGRVAALLDTLVADGTPRGSFIDDHPEAVAKAVRAIIGGARTWTAAEARTRPGARRALGSARLPPLGDADVLVLPPRYCDPSARGGCLPIRSESTPVAAMASSQTRSGSPRSRFPRLVEGRPFRVKVRAGIRGSCAADVARLIVGEPPGKGAPRAARFRRRSAPLRSAPEHQLTIARPPRARRVQHRGTALSRWRPSLPSGPSRAGSRGCGIEGSLGAAAAASRPARRLPADAARTVELETEPRDRIRMPGARSRCREITRFGGWRLLAERRGLRPQEEPCERRAGVDLLETDGCDAPRRRGLGRRRSRARVPAAGRVTRPATFPPSGRRRLRRRSPRRSPRSRLAADSECLHLDPSRHRAGRGPLSGMPVP